MQENDKSSDNIYIKGAREHNLKNIELRIPRGQLVVITGVSGSGKSTLAFDTIYAEGHRKYIDSLSPKARQILDQIPRPDVDYIHGLSPVIAIEQRSGGGANPRATVATVTEIADYARLLWAVCGDSSCPKDGGAIARRSVDDCINRIYQEPRGSRIMILAHNIKAKPAILREELPRIRQRGYQRVRIDGEIKDLDDTDLIDSRAKEITVEIVIDRVVLETDQRSRIADSLELAFREGNDSAIILIAKEDSQWAEFTVSQHFSCESCGTVYDPITPRHFSYNHPEGACPDCGGLGQTLQFMDELIVPDPDKSVKNGAIKPWRLGSKRMIIRRNAILKQLAEQLPYDPKVPWKDLPEIVREALLHGTDERLFSFKLSGGNRKAEIMPFGGVIEDLIKTRSETSSDGLRARLMAYQIGSMCPSCRGKRLSPLSLMVRVNNTGFADFMSLSISESLGFIRSLVGKKDIYNKVADALDGLEQRLHFLNEVGLNYINLDRDYSSLSGGEAQRTRLATQLGMGLVGVVYVLDEPTIGLHPHDLQKLLNTLFDLRNRGNAVIVVEHDETTIRSADYLIELGPGAGADGGQLIYHGPTNDAGNDKNSRIGLYLNGEIGIQKNAQKLNPRGGHLTINGAVHHNLKSIDATFPIGMLCCVTGVSGSGKSTLVNDILANAASFKLHRAKTIPGAHKEITGLDDFQSVVRVNQDPIGRTPRSNPATYTKLFDLLRQLFAQCPLAKVRGYKPSRFSFNVRGGRCERCKGDGLMKLDMQFLSDVYVECTSCLGRRYNRETLDVRFKGYNIAETLEMTVDEAILLFRYQPRIMDKLNTLQAVGLGYIKLGQAANTLSGGEAQRIKLSLELSKREQGNTLYILDEPTTGLHWDDVQKLMDLLFRLRDAGNTIIIIEHNLDVINLADWIIDLGPGGGDKGGEIVYTGLRSNITKQKQSLTAICLNEYLEGKKDTLIQQ